MKSGKAMARTGLRMMPTSPSPPLKFRTAGFPQYGFKASLSGRAFPSASAVKPAPGMPISAPGLHRPFARFHDGRADPARCPDPAVLPRAAVREARGLPTPGVLGSGPSSVVSVHHRYYDPIRQSRGHTATSRSSRLYAAPSLCGSASATRETFPTFPAALSMRAVDLTPVGPRPLPVVPGPRYQASSSYHRVATRDCPSLPAIPDGV